MHVSTLERLTGMWGDILGFVQCAIRSHGLHEKFVLEVAFTNSIFLRHAIFFFSWMDFIRDISFNRSTRTDHNFQSCSLKTASRYFWYQHQSYIMITFRQTVLFIGWILLPLSSNIFANAAEVSLNSTSQYRNFRIGSLNLFQLHQDQRGFG